MTAPAGPAGVFHRAADTYDTVDVPWFRPIAAGLVRELAVRPGERVLDLGCGRGAALVPLAEATGPTGSAIGTDLAPRMVELTAADVAHLPWVQVRLGDAAAPDVPAGSVDVLSCCLVLFFLPDPAAAVRAWRPLLAPGGRVGVTTFGPQDERWKAVDGLFAPYLPQQLKDARTSGTTGPFGSDEGMEALLSAAGLTGLRTVRQEVTARFRDADQWLAWSWSHGQRGLWECVPEADRPAVEQQARELMASFDDLAFSQVVRHTLASAPA